MLKEIERIIDEKRAKRVLLYYPLQSELDVRALLYKLKKRIELFLPYVQGEEIKAVRFRLPLKKGKFAISQPSKTKFCAKKLDLMVVPSLACDGRMGRVGFGKGYYDRFYAKLRTKPYIIFVSYLSVFVKEKITQNFDICGDIALSPRCKMRRKKSVICMDRPYNRSPIGS